jgi:hypothetical protein
LKKPTGSVQFRFYKPKIELNRTQIEKNRKKQSQTRKKPSQTKKREPNRKKKKPKPKKPSQTGLNRFGSVLVFLKKNSV